MTACPSCFQQLPTGRYLWICQSGKCDMTVDSVAGSYLNASIEVGPTISLDRPAGAPRDWGPPRDVACRICSVPSAEACPNCHYPLPAGWRTFDVTTVAMNGARATGKSVYIAVVIKQLRVMLSQLRSTIDFADSRTRDTYTTVYEKPLYELLGIIPPTPPSNTDESYQRHPMIFTLGQLKGLRRVLVIRDVAGEEMEDARENAVHLSFLRHADAIFFMFDPLAIPEVRDKLRDLVPLQQTGRDPRLVLSNLRIVLGPATPNVAVILSKFDALQALRDVDDVDWRGVMSNPGAAFMRDPGLTKAGYDKDDGELLSLEVESLLDKLGAADFVLSLENSPNGNALPHRFFAVSVLGESPDGENVSPLGISPFRITDPIKWLLDAKDIL